MSSLAVAMGPALLGLQEDARMPCCDRAGDFGIGIEIVKPEKKSR